MTSEDRILHLEKTVRRLTLALIAAACLGTGAILSGIGNVRADDHLARILAAQADSQSTPWSGPHPVAAPDNGFVVVPTSGGGYAILTKDDSVAALRARWR